MPVKENWKKEFEKWREEKRKKLKKAEEFVEKIEEPIEEVVEKVEEVEKEVYDYFTEPKHIKILKIIALLIPLVIIGYLMVNNFLVAQEFNYFYDIGSERENYLTPVTRVSEQTDGYREMTGGLVYFDVPIARGSEKVNIKVKFKDNFPKGWTMSLGAKDQEVWHYTYNSIYNPTLNNLDDFNKIENVYLINSDKYLVPIEDLKYERDAIVAVDKPYVPLPNIISDYKEKETIIDTSLRGKHTFYIYASGDLKVNVKKQDINWYEGSDELEIGLYDLEDNLIANLTIEDDVIIEVKNKETAKIQEGVLKAENLEDGVYKLEFGDFDGLIREIKINTNKIVAESVFLADSSLYNVEIKPSKLYFKSARTGQLRLITYHSAGIQNISYKENGVNKTFDFYQEDAPLYMDVNAKKYEIIFPKNDLIVSGVPYFAFSEENYFEPFKQKVVKIQNDMDWIKSNVDYLVTDYKKPTEEGEWLIAEKEFNLEGDSLFVKDNKLSIVFNIPHLSNEEYSNYTIPVDWIEIKVYKPGVFS